MAERKKYIAYGSNMNREQMRYRCPTARVIGTGEIKGYELVFRGKEESAYATVEPREGASVPVVIWDIGKQDEKSLDRYEGYPRFYKKECLEVQVGKSSESIMAYVMTQGQALGMPSVRYLTTIMEGYREAGFEIKRLFQCVSNCQDRMFMEQKMIIEEEKWEQQSLQG